MKHLLICIFFATNFLSCITPKIIKINQSQFDENGNQVLFFSTKPNNSYIENSLIILSISPFKSRIDVFKKLKDEIKKNHFDAIIDIKNVNSINSFGISYIKYSGIGINYK